MNNQYLIVAVFSALLIAALVGVFLVTKLFSYQRCSWWVVKMCAFGVLGIATIQGVCKTIWSDHTFNRQDLLNFSMILVFLILLDVSYAMLLRSFKLEYFKRRKD